VRAATTANITISTALNNADTLDGVTLATGDLVLVKDQSSALQNGIYVVGASPARAVDFDTYDEHAGAVIYVNEGTTNADTLWKCTSNAGGTLNTTAITFAAAVVAGYTPGGTDVPRTDGGTGFLEHGGGCEDESRREHPAQDTSCWLASEWWDGPDGSVRSGVCIICASRSPLRAAASRSDARF
jgi:hypothetical protein